jgi:dCTP deaminase
MILSGADVRQYITHGGLRFNPDLQVEQFQQNGVDLILEEVSDKFLNSGEFTIGRTREFLSMPNDLMAFVQLRSTWARRGFMLPPTVVDAGFRGTITLEIARFGRIGEAQGFGGVARRQLECPVGQRFAHLIFARLSSPSEPYSGKYQGQREITEALEDISEFDSVAKGR